jgi:hypothetical protein
MIRQTNGRYSYVIHKSTYGISIFACTLSINDNNGPVCARDQNSEYYSNEWNVYAFDIRSDVGISLLYINIVNYKIWCNYYILAGGRQAWAGGARLEIYATWAADGVLSDVRDLCSLGSRRCAQ